MCVCVYIYMYIYTGQARRLAGASAGSRTTATCGKWNSNYHGARPVHLIITMIKWIRPSRLSIKNSLSVWLAESGRRVFGEQGALLARPTGVPRS